MNCLIVDDNIMALAIIKKLVSMTSELTMVAECTDALSAYEQMQSQDVDLLFLDIEMPVMNGIDLVKPVSPSRFLVAVEKAKKMHLARVQNPTDKDDEFVFIRDSNIVRRLKVNDILYMEAQGDLFHSLFLKISRRKII